MKYINFLLTLILILSSSLFGQHAHDDILSIELLTERDAAVAGEELALALKIHIQHPWHVYAPVGNDDFTIPVTPDIFTDESPFTVGEWKYPEAEMISVAGVEEPASVYGGDILLQTSITVSPEVVDSIKITGEVYYQACDDARCLIPSALNFALALPVAKTLNDTRLLHADIFQDTELHKSAEASDTAGLDSDAEDDDISGLVDQYGMFLTFALIFLGGLGLNLTPCVYPLIPITISFFGGTDTGKGKTFWMALAYVLGIAVTYSVLGVAAALGGGLFGALLTNPIVLIGIAVILVGLSLSMFGVYEFRLPTGLMTAASQSKAGVFGSFFMGLTLGIVAAPCVGPFVIGLLTYVAAQQSVVLGFSMFFTLAMGLGLPYLFLAMYSSKISSLPRSGTWMVGVRVIFGLVLIAMAIYFLLPILGSWGTPIMAVFLILSGSYLIMFDNSGDGNPVFNRIKQGIAILLIIAGTWIGVPEPEHAGAGIDWMHPESMTELESQLDSQKPIMIDVYADWCIPCKEMDELTFPDPDVVALSSSFTCIKLDLTHQGGEFEKSLLDRFGIKGVPTYIFMKDGEEISHLRSAGFENAEAFLARMEAAL